MIERFFKIFLFILIFSASKLDALKITRAIMSWDQNPTFNFFWPIVSKAWSELIGVRPTLIMLSDKNKKISKLYGDVIYISPLPNIPTPYQAMAVRQLAAALFPDDICIITDLDMLPVNKEYFENAVKEITENNFAVFYPKFHGQKPQYMMCYTAAKGSTYSEIFKVKNKFDIRITLYSWFISYYKDFKNSTDERMLYKYLNEWKDKDTRLSLLKIPLMRLDRPQWNLDEEKIRNKHYADIHLKRPYLDFKSDINLILNLLKLN